MLGTKKGYIVKLRESKTFKGITVMVLLNFVFHIVQPNVSLALTEGPSQPEVQSFEPISTNQMVDLFTGDFNYNIPLFNLPGPNGGYPFNLSYHAGVSMDDEASWVGLGWNINAGSLVRNMRGLPDEFQSKVNNDGEWVGGDFLQTKLDMKKNVTARFGFKPEQEAIGADLASLDLTTPWSFSVYYNNYRGLGFSVQNTVIQGSENSNAPFSLGLSIDSENGVGVSPSLAINDRMEDRNRQYKLGVTFDGSLAVNFSVSDKRSNSTIVNEDGIKKSIYRLQNNGNPMSFARYTVFSPSIGRDVNRFGVQFGFSYESSHLGIYGHAITAASGSSLNYSFGLNWEDLNDNEKNGKKKIPVMGYEREGSNDSDQKMYYSKDFQRQNDGKIYPGSVALPNSYYTYDAYQFTGQGNAGYFRAKRNDVGRVHDAKKTNYSFDVGVNIELTKSSTTIVGTKPVTIPPSPVPIYIPTITTTEGKHLGIDGNIGFGWDTQGPWTKYDNGFLSNELDFDFATPQPSGIKENVYYKIHGEATILPENEYDHVNGVGLTYVKFQPKTGENKDNLIGERRIRVGENPNLKHSRDEALGRVIRNTLVHNLKNKEVGNLGEFQIKHYKFTTSLDYRVDPSHDLNRSTRLSRAGGESVDIGSHNAGYKVLNDDGSYYVYGLPAYNLTEVENQFSIKPETQLEETPSNSVVAKIKMNNANDEVDYKTNLQGDRYINKTTKSPYAHSYLLTSVLGADYVDVDNNGPSKEDLGYWVKFDYAKMEEPYKWRAPYDVNRAQYNRGAAYTDKDDKASYQYGEKEIWYLARVETKSHIAVFDLQPRSDNREAEKEISEDPTSINDNKSGMKLRSIKIFEKGTFALYGNDAKKALQVIHFDYWGDIDPSKELCQQTPNSSSTNKGKLTLKSVWFENFGSTKGSHNKYDFDYTLADVPSSMASLVNPNYKASAYDPWGVYRDYVSTNYEKQAHFPYVNQCVSQAWQGLDGANNMWSQNWMYQTYADNKESKLNKDNTKKAQDLLASAWCLRKIKLPSGGVIEVDYESDDYGYVQHKTANQMFKISRLDDELTTPGELYKGGDNDFTGDATTRRIYFPLEDPIKIGTGGSYSNKIYNDYIRPMVPQKKGTNEEVRYVYFKSKVRLTREVWDYVSGYLELEDNGIDINGLNRYGVDSESVETIDGEQCYTKGYITVKTVENPKDGTPFNYHPMSLAAWTHLQTEAPDLLNNGFSFDSENVGVNNILGHVVDFINVIPTVMSQFGGYRAYCKLADYGRFIDLNNSVIRLASPDKIKYGGGHRVREIKITDNWSSDVSGEASRSYGQHFDYTMEEGGKVISSGVAQYEPQAGGDENALKFPIEYAGKQSIYTSNNLFVEAPFNEDLYPGASVGYRKVSVTSTNTNEQIRRKIAVEGGDIDPESAPYGRTGGITIHEFYTAKEFPTISESSTLSEENDTKSVFHVPIPIPFIGTISRDYYHGSQGFLIELNDMHGKPKAVSSYELNNYKVGDEPITETFYEYQFDESDYQGESIKRLKNEVSVIRNNGSHDVDGTKRLLGVDVDFYTDQRESKTYNSSIGLGVNVDMIIKTPPIPPVVSFWPAISNHKTMFRTYVTNKVVHRTGLLSRTVTRDLQTSENMEIIAYDEKSGHPLLTKMTNEYGDAFYDYNIPAYYHYERMGHAYQNINYNFNTTLVDLNNSSRTLYFSPSAEDLNYLTRGDELLVSSILPVESLSYKKAYFLGWKYVGTDVFGIVDFPQGWSSQEDVVANLKVIRSGYRNHHSTMAANYKSKEKITLGAASQVLRTNEDGSTVSTKVITSQNVLSATASVYNDDWASPKDRLAEVVNPFLTGNSGIFRPYKSYTYVGPRKMTGNLNPTSSNSELDLRNDGVFQTAELPMFTWDLGHMEDYVSNWEWVNEVTRFNEDAYELENVNRLGIYSSALYGYGNSLSIAVGGNSSYHELGAIDFETVPANNIWYSGQSMKETNINLFNGGSGGAPVFLSKTFTIKKSKTTADGNLEIQFSNPSDELQNLFTTGGNPVNYGLTLNSQKNNTYAGNISTYLNGNYVSHEYIPAAGSTPMILKVVLKPFLNHVTDNNLKTNGEYTGKMTVLTLRDSENTNNATTVSFVSGKAHTGKKSMKTTEKTIFDQAFLQTLPGKEYVLSAWISRDDVKVKDFKNPSGDPVIIPGYRNSGVFTPVTGFTIRYGKIVEGWQKVEIEFTGTSENSMFAIKFDGGDNPMYVDDLRFSPKTGGITTYVYDPINFRLKASLNVDNYATLFFYDTEGNLTLKKQETEEGIVTITQSRGNVSRDN